MQFAPGALNSITRIHTWKVACLSHILQFNRYNSQRMPAPTHDQITSLALLTPVTAYLQTAPRICEQRNVQEEERALFSRSTCDLVL
jgi:hypothetical protein